MPIVTACRRCGAEFEADRRVILGGGWRLCPPCREGDPTPAPAQPPAGRCDGCGRELRTGHRRLCAGCLGVPS